MFEIASFFGENANPGNGTTTLRMGTSSDGITFNAIPWSYNGSHAGGLRDPSLTLINGTFAIVYTASAVNSFGLATASTVGAAFQDLADVSCATLPGTGTASHCWAPEWFVDPVNNSLHVIVAISTTGPTSTGFDFYEVHPSTNTDGSINLASWSNPVQLATSTVGWGTNSGERIDPFVVYVPSNTTYYLFYAQEGGPNSGPIGLASSSALLGTYTLIDDGYSATKGWHNFLEGPSIINRQGTWWAYADNYSQDVNYSGGIYYTTSTSPTFNAAVWGSSSKISTPNWPQVKHGTILINGVTIVSTNTYTNFGQTYVSTANNGTATNNVEYVFGTDNINQLFDVGTGGLVTAAGNLTGYKGDGNGIMGRG